jgi:hypothetical protein
MAASSPLAPFGWSKSGCCLLLAALAGYCMAAASSSQKQLPAGQPNTVSISLLLSDLHSQTDQQIFIL